MQRKGGSSNWNGITIREYVEVLLKAHDREHELRHESLKLQALEYERRLHDLNNAHTQALNDRGTFMTKEMYETRDRETRAASRGNILLALAAGGVGAAILNAFLSLIRWGGG